jgi:hypothetical protein
MFIRAKIKILFEAVVMMQSLQQVVQNRVFQAILNLHGILCMLSLCMPGKE